MHSAQFGIGQVIRHRRFGYRGVIIDVDAEFSLTDEWYEQVARSRPPRDKPWYHVLVDGQPQQTYVAERHLERDPAPSPVDHPAVALHLGAWSGDHYAPQTGGGGALQ